MKFFTLSLLLSFLSLINFAQNHSIHTKNNEGALEFSINSTSAFSIDQQKEWLNYLPTSGEITYCNSKQQKMEYKGSCLVYLSEKPSPFQTEMFFTIEIEANQIQLKNIYYQSIPSYQKQGNPAVISYAQDWFAKEKFYKKSGKAKYLHQVLKKNTILKAEQILASCSKFH
jgi:hypothetical protein